jgi:hypothetical protein
MFHHRSFWLTLAVSTLVLPGRSPAIDFDRIVIDDNLPGAYQVEVADVNGDGRPDVVAVGGGTCAWYENPRWTKRLVATPKETPGIISSATADLDGDGRAEVAIAYEFAMNSPTKGKLLLAVPGKSLDDPWSHIPIAEIGSIHRLRWGDVDGDGKRELVVAPIFGTNAKPPLFDQDPARITLLRPGADPKSGRWETTLVGTAHVLHAIDVLDLDGDGRSDVLGASSLGVTRYVARPGNEFEATVLAPGAPGETPKKGASEVHVGRLRDGRRFIATVEPWHGTEVAVYTSQSPGSLAFGPRTVIDATLKLGHALWVADVDRDGDDEIFAGYRDQDARVLVFDWSGKAWERAFVDPATAAQDLRGADLDADGVPDVVAAGGRTHNVVWYRPKGQSR